MLFTESSDCNSCLPGASGGRSAEAGCEKPAEKIKTSDENVRADKPGEYFRLQDFLMAWNL